LITAAVMFCFVGVAHAQPEQRPNILFIMSDDHAAHAISAYGSKVNTTPNIDR
jgi:arylsulfatase A-like enzyme